MNGTVMIVYCAAIAGLAVAAGGCRLRSRGGFWLLIGLVALGIAAGLFGKFGGFGLGTGDGSGDNGPEAASATTGPKTPPPDTRPKPPTRPLKITIDGQTYYVHDREVSLEEITEMLGKIPEGPGPAVVVTLTDDSRPTAEIGLKALLKKHNVPYLWPQ